MVSKRYAFTGVALSLLSACTTTKAPPPSDIEVLDTHVVVDDQSYECTSLFSNEFGSTAIKCGDGFHYFSFSKTDPARKCPSSKITETGIDEQGNGYAKLFECFSVGRVFEEINQTSGEIFIKEVYVQARGERTYDYFDALEAAISFNIKANTISPQSESDKDRKNTLESRVRVYEEAISIISDLDKQSLQAEQDDNVPKTPTLPIQHIGLSLERG